MIYVKIMVILQYWHFMTKKEIASEIITMKIKPSKKAAYLKAANGGSLTKWIIKILDQSTPS